MSEHGEYEHDVDTVNQEDPDGGLPVRVEVVGPVVTQAAPAIDGDIYSVTIDASGGVEDLAGGDSRRSYMAITSAAAFRVATSRDAIRSPLAGLWPANSTLVIRHRAPVFVRSTTADQVITASVERWAD